MVLRVMKAIKVDVACEAHGVRGPQPMKNLTKGLEKRGLLPGVFTVATTGFVECYIAEQQSDSHPYKLSDLRMKGFQVIKWNGRYVHCIGEHTTVELMSNQIDQRPSSCSRHQWPHLHDACRPAARQRRLGQGLF